jgi:hypothetical protein
LTRLHYLVARCHAPNSVPRPCLRHCPGALALPWHAHVSARRAYSRRPRIDGPTHPALISRAAHSIEAKAMIRIEASPVQARSKSPLQFFVGFRAPWRGNPPHIPHTISGVSVDAGCSKHGKHWAVGCTYSMGPIPRLCVDGTRFLLSEVVSGEMAWLLANCFTP